MNKKYIASIVTSAVVLASLGTATLVSANSNGDHQASLITALSQRFNLNVADVQKVFDDHKTQKQIQVELKAQEKLSKLVTAGKLTQDQVNKIKAKRAEIIAGEAAFKASLQGKTKDEIKVAIKARMDALEQWAKNNNIPLQYLYLGFKGHHRGFGFGHYIGEKVEK